MKTSFKYLIPLATKFFGYEENILVNRKNNIQTERAIKSVEINATNYKSNEPLVLYVVQEHMRLTPFWINFLAF